MIKKTLGKMLVEGGYINNYQLSEALIKQKANPNMKLGDILIQLGYLTKEILYEILKKQTETAEKSVNVKETISKNIETLYKITDYEKTLTVVNKELTALIRLLIKNKLIKIDDYFDELKREE